MGAQFFITVAKFTTGISQIRAFCTMPSFNVTRSHLATKNDGYIILNEFLVRQSSLKLSQQMHYISVSRDMSSISGEKVPDLHEPAYLADLKPKLGYYDLLDLQLKGYDYVVLEKYQGYLHRTMKKMNFHVIKAWSAPYQELQLENLGDRTTAIENSYKIKIYERNLQMKEALVTKLPLLIDIINITSPPGVSFSIHRHTSTSDDKLYFRDSVLEKLKDEFQELKDTPLIGVTV